MLIPAHRDQIVPGQLWGSWADPVLWLAVGLPLVAFLAMGRATNRRGVVRRRCTVAAGCAVGVAVLSPLDAASGALASAHMVQHLLLTTVAAPLLALGRPWRRVVTALPLPARRALHRVRRSPVGAGARWLGHDPLATSALAVLALWVWHVPPLYDAALAAGPLHAVEHASFLVTSVLAWGAVLRPAAGLGPPVLALFVSSLASGLLGFLLAFSPSPWYAGYRSSTAAWGLSPIEDQRLAGLLMWIPGGGVLAVVAVTLVVRGLADPGTRSAGFIGTRPG